MKRVLALLTLLITLSTYALSASSSPVQPFKATADGRVFCTTFSINEVKGYWATANHCIKDDKGAVSLPYIGDSGEPTKLVAEFPDVDMAVISSSFHAPALPMASQAPKSSGLGVKGDEVQVYGFGWGFDPPTAFWGRVANTVQIEGRKFYIFDMRVWPGHSGSPVLNIAGQVISVTQISADGAAGGATYEDMSKRLSKYWE